MVSSVIGRIRRVTSFINSTRVPPIPKVSTFPKAGSVFPPMISSSPGAACCSTMTPLISASGLYAFAFETILSNASSAACFEDILTITPPASLLWTIWGEWIFMTTGKPIFSATLPASAGVLTIACSGTGTSYCFRRSYDSNSLNILLTMVVSSYLDFLIEHLYDSAVQVPRQMNRLPEN